MNTTALTTTTDRALTATELTARDVFNIWLADQSELTQTVYKAEVTAFLDWTGNRRKVYISGTWWAISKLWLIRCESSCWQENEHQDGQATR